MTTIYFAGQDNFGNRGCEALVRANVKTIRQFIPQATFLVPTHNVNQDSRQWPDAQSSGVRFVPAEPIPSAIRWWSRARRIFSALDAKPPSLSISKTTRDAILKSDALVMTGGDIISLDYGLESLYYWMRICEVAMDAGIPSILWGASVGPFDKMPAVEKLMVKFLKRFSLITVRETATLKYLQDLGILNVELVADSAFALEPEAAPAECLNLFNLGKPVLGFNVSPLIRKFRESDERKDALDQEITGFLAQVLKQGEVLVQLIPHVDPLSGATENSDSAYMEGILARLRESGFGNDAIAILPRTLNAAQLKDVLRRCTYFMGARTHATVGSLSQLVPTTSIAYSIKAKGINQDLLGNIRYVLETPAVTQQTLLQHYELLQQEAEHIKTLLANRMPEWKHNASKSAELLLDLIDRKQRSVG